MSTHESSRNWEDWQLTAYLLGECEPEVAEQIARAAEQDAQVAAQLKELAETLDDVKAVLSADSVAVADQAALAKLKGAFETQVEPCTAPVQPANYPAASSRKMWLRWETWAALATVALVALLWSQHDRTSRLAFNAIKTQSGPQNVTTAPRFSDGLDDSVIHEAWNLAPTQVAVQPAAQGSTPVVGDFAAGQQAVRAKNEVQASREITDSVLNGQMSSPDAMPQPGIRSPHRLRVLQRFKTSQPSKPRRSGARLRCKASPCQVCAMPNSWMPCLTRPI